MLVYKTRIKNLLSVEFFPLINFYSSYVYLGL
jgi:hypothetical protein